MKKLLISFVILSGTFLSASAQKSNSVEFGINIGSNESYITQGSGNYDQTKSDNVYGLNVGFSAEYYFSDRWGLKGKLIYDQKGWGNGYLVNADGSETDGVNFQLNYITVPLMANWHFARNRNWYLNFGPYVGFLLSAKETNDNVDVKDAFNSTDVGFALGIGVKIPLSNKVKLFIEAEGQGGGTNITTDNSGPTIQTGRSSLNIGLNF